MFASGDCCGEHQNPLLPRSLLMRPSREQNVNIDLPCMPVLIMHSVVP